MGFITARRLAGGSTSAWSRDRGSLWIKGSVVRENTALVCVHVCDRSEMARQTALIFVLHQPPTAIQFGWTRKMQKVMLKSVSSPMMRYLWEKIWIQLPFSLSKKKYQFSQIIALLASHTTKHIWANIWSSANRTLPVTGFKKLSRN